MLRSPRSCPARCVFSGGDALGPERNGAAFLAMLQQAIAVSRPSEAWTSRHRLLFPMHERRMRTILCGAALASALLTFPALGHVTLENQQAPAFST